MISTTTHATSLGDVVLVGADDALAGLYFADGRHPPYDELPAGSFPRACAQLDEYLAGARRTFDLPLAPVGTPFQQRVWAALLAIPYGETRTYAEVARALGTGPRAVGLANGRNPLSIVVPCHRLVGSDGTLTGYGGGIARKRELLVLEGSLHAQSNVLQ
jgi:methylated-DNA-[protein]-cysteine S-methyltransferase